MRITFLFLGLLGSFFCSADVDLDSLQCTNLNNGLQHYKTGDYDAALKDWIYVIHNTNDTTDCFSRCFNNIPLTYWQMDNIELARVWWLYMLESGLRDGDLSNDLREDYTNYKHFAAENLVKLYYAGRDYKSALYYLNKATTTFPYRTLSALKAERKQHQLALYAHDIQLAKADTQAAIKALFEVFLLDDAIVADSSAAVIAKELLQTVEGYQTIDRFRFELNQSLANLKVVELEAAKKKDRKKVQFQFLQENYLFRLAKKEKLEIKQEMLQERLKWLIDVN